MATLCTDPRITFIHIPKAGGNSVTHWMRSNLKNVLVTKRKQHATVEQTKAGKLHTLGPIEDLGFTFCVVRNPFDYLVSFFEFRRRICIQYIDLLEKNPHLVNHKHKRYNLHGHQNRLKLLDSMGFEEWAVNHSIDPQTKWAKDCDYVMKLENIENDFKVIQEKTNCFEPLPHKNKTGIRKKDYREYYTKSETIKFVEDRFIDDIKSFGYTF